MKILPGKEEEYAQYKAANTDPYSNAVVQFGDRLADALEPRIAAGEKLADIYEAVGREVDKDLGITGFQYGYAMKVLAHFWVHGEELRQAHNASYGVGPEQKGTVNPAIITIG